MGTQRPVRSNSGKPSLRVLLRADAATWLGLLRWWTIWLALGLLVAAMVAAYQVPHRYAIDVGSPADEALLLMVLWAAILPIFVLVNYKVDMIGKHLFFTMLPLALAGGLALFRPSRKVRWRPARAGLAFVLIGLQAIFFWIQRPVETST